MQYTKFDVAERQLLQAIKLFFNNEDPISIHTLSESAGQVLNDIGKEYDAISFIRTNDLIKPEKRTEWLNHIFKSRNFFKHANKDKNEVHEFKSEFNDFSLLDSVNMYCSIKKKWVPETIMFQMWFSANYPSVLIKESEFNQVILNGVKSGYPMDKETMFKIIQMFRNKEIENTNVTLEYGL